MEDPGLVLGKRLFPVWVIDQVFPDPASRKITLSSQIEDTQGKHKPHSEILFLQLHGLIHDDD